MAYPMDFFDSWTGGVDAALCFGIMPFAGGFDDVWEEIQRTAGADPFNLRCLRADDVVKPGFIMEDVLQYVAQAGTIIADLTGRNANVFYELGLAHGRRPAANVILIAQSMEDVPFDLQHLRCITYNPSLDDLAPQLRRFLSGAVDRRFSLRLGERETGRFAARIIGPDRCFYELEVTADYLGYGGAKTFYKVFRLVGGRDPEVFADEGPCLVEDGHPLSLPGMGWSLHYDGGDEDHVQLLLTRDPAAP